jgi:L-ascorbate metabolism protein UlaG (beta-lactamase superfamily)
MKGSGYRCGDVFSFLIEYHGFRLYHLGSAQLVEDAIPREARDVDLLLLCIAARFATERFIPRALTALSPSNVMPMHYDFMWRSAEKPMRLLPRTDFGRLVDDVQAFSRDMSVLTLPLLSRPFSPEAPR